MSEQLQRCKCGEPHDNWPGEDGGLLCQMCWEDECDKAWWRMVKAISAEAPIANRVLKAGKQ